MSERLVFVRDADPASLLYLIEYRKQALEKSLSIDWQVTSTSFPSGVRPQEIVGRAIQKSFC
jgi:hypothetical protein